MKHKDKTYIELANSRYRDNKQARQDKLELDRDKFNHQKRKDTKNSIISIIIGLPIFILIITFTIIGIKFLVE